MGFSDRGVSVKRPFKLIRQEDRVYSLTHQGYLLPAKRGSASQHVATQYPHCNPDRSNTHRIEMTLIRLQSKLGWPQVSSLGSLVPAVPANSLGPDKSILPRAGDRYQGE